MNNLIMHLGEVVSQAIAAAAANVMVRPATQNSVSSVTATVNSASEDTSSQNNITVMNSNASTAVDTAQFLLRQSMGDCQKPVTITTSSCVVDGASHVAHQIARMSELCPNSTESHVNHPINGSVSLPSISLSGASLKCNSLLLPIPGNEPITIPPSEPPAQSVKLRVVNITETPKPQTNQFVTIRRSISASPTSSQESLELSPSPASGLVNNTFEHPEISAASLAINPVVVDKQAPPTTSLPHPNEKSLTSVESEIVNNLVSRKTSQCLENYQPENPNTCRPTVLMAPRDNSSPISTTTSITPAVALSIVLQDHNYVTISRRSPLPRIQSPLSSPTYGMYPSSSSPTTKNFYHSGGSSSKSLNVSNNSPSPPTKFTKSRAKKMEEHESGRKVRADKGQTHSRRGAGRGGGGRRGSRTSNTVANYTINNLPPSLSTVDLLALAASQTQRSESIREEVKLTGSGFNATNNLVDRIRHDSTSTKSASEVEDEERELSKNIPASLPPPSTIDDMPMRNRKYEKKSSSQPSGEPQYDEAITRCICEFLHDDGFMIACDKCSVWQHCECMLIDRTEIPETYFCEQCQPRWISRSRAKTIQMRKLEIIERGGSLVTPNVTTDTIPSSGPGISPPQQPQNLVGAITGNKVFGKIKRRGRPSLSNGHHHKRHSDSDGEFVLSGSSPGKRSRKFSGRRPHHKQDSSSPRGPGRSGLKKNKLGENRVKRSYTRRHTVPSVSVPSHENLTFKTPSPNSIEKGRYSPLTTTSLNDSDDKVFTPLVAPLDENHRLPLSSHKSFEDCEELSNGATSDTSAKGFSGSGASGGDAQTDAADGDNYSGNSSGRKAPRKQTFRSFANGDLSPPHIISTGSTSTKQLPKSPVMDKSQNSGGLTNGFLSSGSSSMSSPESSYGANSSTSPISLPLLTSCPYSSSPFLEKYEEAENAVCSYSQELRAKLLKHHNLDSNFVPDFRILSDESKRWKLGITSLEGGKKLKTLLGSCRMQPNEAVIELVGKYQMSTSFMPTSKKVSPSNATLIYPEPFAFFHQVPKNGMCISIDLRKYGNEARFVRRSCNANAEIRHVVGKGTLHAYIVTTRTVELDEEITIPHEFQTISKSTNFEYYVAPIPLPCACVDISTCTARISDVPGAAIPVMAEGVNHLHKRNGALASLSQNALPLHSEPKERKKRLSSRRTSSIDKESLILDLNGPTDVLTDKQPHPSPVPALQSSNVSHAGTEPSPVSLKEPVSDPSKERTTRARSAAALVPEEVPYVPARRSRTESSTSRQRNKSGANENKNKEIVDPTIQTTSSVQQQQHNNIDTLPVLEKSDSKPLSREERKLQSVLRLIERLENNQKKKENRQTQKKDKRDRKDDDDHDEDHQVDNGTPTTIVPPRSVKFLQSPQKRRGKKRGRAGSYSNKGKPQMIKQRSSGSGGDMRSTSTESDMNSGDEIRGDREQSPLRDPTGDNSFRLPKTKKALMSEWYNASSPTSSPSGELNLPQQYMRRVVASSSSSPSAVTASNQQCVTPTNVSASIAPGNTVHDNASAKKRWLRQAISEETDNPSPNSSRPMSPVSIDCVAPLKKRHFARSSVSSEVSNTPPLTPNPAEGQNSDHELESDNEIDPSTNPSENYDLGKPDGAEVLVDISDDEFEKGTDDHEPEFVDSDRNHKRKASKSPEPTNFLEGKKYKAESELDSIVNNDEVNYPETPKLRAVNQLAVQNLMEKLVSVMPSENMTPTTAGFISINSTESHILDTNSEKLSNSTSVECEFKSTISSAEDEPSKCTSVTPRRSRWDQVESSESSSITSCTSPVKGLVDPMIVLDYKRDKNMCMKPNFAHNPADTGVSRRLSLDKPERPKAININFNQNQISEDDICKANRHESPEGMDTPGTTKRKLSILEYRQRRKEGRTPSDTESNSTPSSTSVSKKQKTTDISSELTKDKDLISSPNIDNEGQSKANSILSWSPTPTLAERKREELSQRLTSLGIRISDSDNSSSPSEEKSTAPLVKPTLSTLTRPEKVSKPKVITSYGRTNPSNRGPPHRLSVPTPGALKQSGMPPLPLHMSSSTYINSNNITNNGPTMKVSSGEISNGYPPIAINSGMSSSGVNYHQYSRKLSQNQKQHSSRGPNLGLPNSSPSPVQPSNGASNAIIGGIPIGGLIPPPPPPTNQPGPAFTGRFFNQKFFPQT